MRFDIVTLFPEMFNSLTSYGITGRAYKNKHFEIHYWNPRNFAEDKHRTVDARPYGGGPGMVLLPEILSKTTDCIIQKYASEKYKIIYPSAQGKPANHEALQTWMECKNWIIICGRYEGIDQRFIDLYVDENVSLGNLVVSGGELPAMMLIDATLRQLKNVLGNDQSIKEESFVDGLLDCPHFTRPEIWRGKKVPKVLLSGDHKEIANWRQQQKILLTKKVRPNLIKAKK